MSMFLFSLVLLPAFSSEAHAQDMWQPTAPPNPAWGPDRDEAAYSRAYGVDVYVCPPEYPYPESHRTSNDLYIVGCSNGSSSRYLYNVPFSEEITKDNGERIDVRFEGWLEVVIYAYMPGGHHMPLPQAIPGLEETVQVMVSNGRVTLGYYDPETGTVVAPQGWAPGNRISRRRFFFSGPVSK